jgi:DNA (cytosine-5)-methyltransferase 1
LQAQFLDVPQKRERLIIMGIRKDLDMPWIFPRMNRPIIPLYRALANIGESSSAQFSAAKKEVMKQVPEGGNWRNLDVELQKKYLGASYNQSGGKTGMARRLSRYEPSLTLTCAPSQKQTERGHPTENRPLSIREYARIQTFPDEWIFAGSLQSQYRQIGNAVPVNLAYHLGHAVRYMLEDKQDIASQEIINP